MDNSQNVLWHFRMTEINRITEVGCNALATIETVLRLGTRMETDPLNFVIIISAHEHESYFYDIAAKDTTGNVSA